MIRLFTLAFALLLSSGLSLSVLQAQALDQFSENPKEYLDQLEELMTASKRDVMEDLFKEYKKNVEGGAYTEDELKIIIQTSNAMLGQKMKASPYFSDYLTSLLFVKKRENAEQVFTDWHNVLNTILANIVKRKLKPYQEFLKFSKTYLEHNALKYSKSGVNWVAVSDQVDITYENNQPVLKYAKADLIASRKKDSIIIYQTQGSFFPVENIWEGSGGKVDWARFERPDVYFNIQEYSIDAKKAIYTVKRAQLNHPDYFPNSPIWGSFSDKIVSSNSSKEGSYPRFQSEEARLNINNIGGGIKYQGGFKLQGRTVYGFGEKGAPARVEIFEPGTNQIILRGFSDQFVMRKGERIAGDGVEMTLFMQEDSLYHPSCNLKFDIADRALKLTRGKRGSDRNPFFNSIQQMNIDVDNINYYMEGDSIVIGQKLVSFQKGINKVTFESLNFFNEGDFQRLQNISSVNPVTLIRAVSEREGTRELDANLVAEKFNSKFDATSIQSLIYDMVSQGFVNYDSDTETIIVKDKIFHYSDASAEKVDFDALRVISDSDSANAVIRLGQNDMITNGVKSVNLSTKQRVAFKPFGRQVVIKKNRDMDFHGRIFAGFALFEGKDFAYNYDEHQVHMDSVRYFDLYVPTGVVDKNGIPEALSIGSRIEYISGDLLVDAPNNKSGKEDLPTFPSFNSVGNSYVFYDVPGNQKRAYTRDSFYFRLDEFNFNSLDQFAKSAVEFKGTMVSADIFPDFEETIKIREEDESLGFVTETPEEGYPAYRGQGNYKGSIDLSNQGFLGKGTVDYLTATFESEDIVFKPKQLTATADRFDLDEDIPKDIPQASGVDVSIDWRPYRDSMYVRSKEEAFKVFKEEGYNLDGLLILTPDGLRGRGDFEWTEGLMTSKLMSFGVFDVRADTANLKIKALEGEDFAFDTRSVNAELDFKERIGRVTANLEDHVTTMPYNQYETSLREFVWDMEKQTVTFQNESGGFGRFTSIHPNQDSLTFSGKTAFYDLKTSLLKIGGVPRIQASDAYIYTETGDIEIQKGGVMTQLTNARIVADTISKYHVINRATVNILGKKEYRANGYYEYNIGDREQEILFADIVGTRVGKGKRSEKKSVTRADGEVKEEDNFYIDTKTEFRGKIGLDAASKNLSFDGFARIDSKTLPNPQWFSVKFEGDKNDLAIEYNVPKNYEGEPLRTGLFLSKEFVSVYPRVMMPLRLRKDRPIMEAKGLFKYDRKEDIFSFGDSLKIASNVRRGTKLTYNDKDGSVEAEGPINIGSGLLGFADVEAAGNITTRFGGPVDTTAFMANDAEIQARMMTGVMMHIPEKLLKIMIQDFKSSSFDARIIDYLRETELYENALAHFVTNDKDLANSIAKMKNLGLSLPGKYNPYDLFFSKLEMKWNPELQSFLTTGSEVGLNSIANEPINRMIKGYIEFKMPSNEDDRVYVYLKSPSDFYYFFGYKQGILSIVSNNDKFMEELEGMKKKEYFIKIEDQEDPLEIQPVSSGSAQMFVNRIRGGQ